jgi:hypothetical protein
MTVSEIKEKYRTKFEIVLRVGHRKRLILIGLIIAAPFVAYVKAIGRSHSGITEEELLMSLLAYIVIIAVFVAVVLTINPMSFINQLNRNKFRFAFKKDLEAYLKQDIPEITDYLYLRRIDAPTFKASGLFTHKYSDYQGDDWLKGVYRNVKFELCELHVFNIFKPIFSGFFVKCKLGCDALTQPEEQIASSIVSLKSKYNVTVNLSEVQGNIYMAIGVDGQLLENNSRKSIENVERDIALIKDIVGLVKVVVDANSKLAV